MKFAAPACSLRLFLLACFSLFIVACGSGDGEDPVGADAGETASSRQVLVFRDDFGGPAASPRSGALAGKSAPEPLALGNWVVDTGYGPNGDGWGNNEWQRYTSSMDNVYVENGLLVLRAQCLTAPDCNQRDGTITSGKILSKDRINVKFGTVRARIKMPSGGGMWPAFWMLGADIDERPWPDAGEIDIVEMFYYYSDTRTTHFTLHWAGPGDSSTRLTDAPTITDGEVHLSATAEKKFKAEDGFAPLTDDFHVYELDWNENRIIGKIDGVEYFNRGIDGDTMEEFLKDYYLILNVAVGGALGGPDGPWMTKAQWDGPLDEFGNPDRSLYNEYTDMLVDYVEIWERVPETSATLIAESGKNIRYNGILNSINFGGGLVEVKKENEDVPALVGSKTMSIRFSNTFTGEPGSRPVGFSGAIFDFSGKDLADYDHFHFSIDTSRFAGFRDIGVEFEDRDGNKVMIRTRNYSPISVSGTWRTYSIPMADFPGIDMANIVGIGFFNPYDASENLLAGTVYFDDIRFTRTAECNALSSIEFDQVNYNPDTVVAAIDVHDPCAANLHVRVKAENESGEVYLQAKLDAAGNGRAILNLGKNGSAECAANDTTGVLHLTGTLMASYERPMAARGGPDSSFAAAGVDPGAPITTLTGDTDYILATSEETAFIPETDFNFSDFGTGSTFNGNFRGDATFSPVFAISNVANGLPQMALFNFIKGFTRKVGKIDLKVKNLPNGNITVKFGNTDGAAPENTYTVNVASDPESTPLSDGWYLVSIPMTNFADPDQYNYVVFAADQTASAATFLITDIALQERIGNLPAECAVPPVSGSGTGATGATGGPFSISFDDAAVSYGFVGFGDPDTVNSLAADPVDAGNLVATTTKLAGSQVWAGVTVETIPGITWPLSAAESEITMRIYSPGPGLVVRMKAEVGSDAGQFVETDAVTTVDTGWETLTFDFNDPVSSPINESFDYDKLSLFFGFGTPGDGTTYTWDTIEFQGTGGGGGGNLATNGDFEAGDLSGWTDNPGSGTIEAVDTENSGSTWSGRISTGMGNGAALSQANLAVGTVQPFDTIDIAFDLCGTLEGVSGEFRPALLSEFGMGTGALRQDLSNFTTLPSVWTRYNFQATAGDNVAGGISLQFDAICGAVAGCAVEAFIDNVTITIDGGMVPGTASGESCDTGGGGSAEPMVAAPQPPARNPVDVISLFSDAYTDVTVDTWRTSWSAATLDETFSVGGSATKLYTGLDFVGIEFFNPAVDASTMTHFHVDVWTPDATSGGEVFRVKLVDFGTATTEHEIVFDSTTTPALATGAWVSLDIPLSDFAGLAGVSNLSQLIFSGTLGGGPGQGTVYVDNVYFYNSDGGPVTEPPVAAPQPPARNPVDVISLFSDAYTDVTVDTWRTSWSAATLDETFSVGGSATKLYTGLDFVGIEFFNPAVDASTMTHFHVDVWTPDATSGGEVFRVKLVDFGTATTEHEIVFDSTTTPALATGAWVSLDIPLSDFAGLAGVSNLSQLIFSGTLGGGPGQGTVYIDNVYFYKSGSGGGTGEIAVNGSFESGDFTGWTQFESSPGNQTVNMSMAGDTSSDGSFHLEINNVTSGTNSLIKQERAGLGVVAPGAAWTVTFDARGTFGPGGVAFAQVFCETAMGNENCNSGGGILGGVPLALNADPTVWTSFSFSGTAGPTTESLTLQLEAVTGGGNLANMFYDNISIVVGP